MFVQPSRARVRQDVRSRWWAHVLHRNPDELDDDEEPFSPDAESLRRFIEEKALPILEAHAIQRLNHVGFEQVQIVYRKCTDAVLVARKPLGAEGQTA